MDPISIERLDRAILKIARLIETTGENYWPVLERLEAEREACASRELRLQRYLSKHPPRPTTRQRASRRGAEHPRPSTGRADHITNPAVL
jgi:hypothetical protein